eukprot:TRINITY_DN4103_c0_g1_i2.p1 TRINITY_DN4103_c0_g1~~TRINITY_DN4103_c0_g1_i2.p1  ORF type:complete len:199 (-),score=24.45 TRINITY_DN4103_c0_g1_i2:49-645(-)
MGETSAAAIKRKSERARRRYRKQQRKMAKDRKDRATRIAKYPIKTPFPVGSVPLHKPVRLWGAFAPKRLFGELAKVDHLIAQLRIADRPLSSLQLWDRIRHVPESQISSHREYKSVLHSLEDSRRVSLVTHPENFKSGQSKINTKVFLWMKERTDNHFLIPQYLLSRFSTYTETRYSSRMSTPAPSPSLSIPKIPKVL